MRFAFTTLHGFPTAIALEQMSLQTIDPAPIITLFPIFTPGNKTLLAPMNTLFPIMIGELFECSE